MKNDDVVGSPSNLRVPVVGGGGCTNTSGIILSSSEISLLVGPRLARPSVFPDGLYRVIHTSGPLTPQILANEPDPSIVSDDTIAQAVEDVEKKLEDVIPFDTETSQQPLDIPPPLGVLADDKSITEFIINQDDNSKGLRDNVSEFSLWRCFVDPQTAVDPKKCKGFALCRISIGECELLPADQGSNSQSHMYPHVSSSITRCDPSINNNNNNSPLQHTDSGSHDKLISPKSSKQYIPNSLLCFLAVSLGDLPLYRTRVISVPSSWGEEITVDLHSLTTTINLELYDKDFSLDATVEDEERIAGIKVNLEDLEFNVPCATMIEVTLQLPPAIPLSAALQEALLPNDVSDDEVVTTAAAVAVTSPVVEATENRARIDSRCPQEKTAIYENVCLRVHMKLELIPAPNINPSASLWAAGALKRIPLQSTVITASEVSATSLDIYQIYNQLLRLKFILWDNFQRSYIYWYQIKTWKKPLETSSLLLLIWSFWWYPNLLISGIFALLTIMALCLPSWLPPIPYVLYETSSLHLKHDETTNPKDVSSAISFLSKIITVETIENGVLTQRTLFYFGNKIEQIYNAARNLSLLSPVVVMLIVFTIISLIFPNLVQIITCFIATCTTLLLFFINLDTSKILWRWFQALVWLWRRKFKKVDSHIQTF